jgi:cysteine desulfurase
VNELIYLDYAATTPMDEEALEVYMGAAKKFFANPSSLHDEGTAAKQLLEFSRRELSKLIGVNEQTVIFTSGGTESNMLAIETLLSSKPHIKNHIICSKLEHTSILNWMTKLEQNGYEVSYLTHQEDGTISLDDLKSKIKDETCLVIVQHVNSEIGCIQPIEVIKRIIGDIYLHTDCVQSFTKLPLQQIAAICDSMSISSHKVYGPKGVGAVIFPTIHALKPAVSGVSHEMGFRAGTANLPGIASFVTAAKATEQNRESEIDRMTVLRKILLSELSNRRTIHERYESKHAQLPHIIGLAFPGIQGQMMLLELNRAGFAVSTGSACSIGNQEPSKTMIAIGKTKDEAKALIRISLGKHVTEEQILSLAKHISLVVRKLEPQYGKINVERSLGAGAYE